jgi:hypothetical protein
LYLLADVIGDMLIVAGARGMTETGARFMTKTGEEDMTTTTGEEDMTGVRGMAMMGTEHMVKADKSCSSTSRLFQ